MSAFYNRADGEHGDAPGLLIPAVVHDSVVRHGENVKVRVVICLYHVRKINLRVARGRVRVQIGFVVMPAVPVNAGIGVRYLEFSQSEHLLKTNLSALILQKINLLSTRTIAYIGGGGYNNINEKSGGDTNESFYGQGFSA